VVVVVNLAILLIAPFEWRWACITLGLSSYYPDRGCEFVKFLLFDLNWMYGVVLGSGLIAAIAVGRDGLKGRSRRNAQFGLVAALTLFAINHLALVQIGNGDDVLVSLCGGAANLAIGTPPGSSAWVIPYGRVFFDEPVLGMNVEFAPRITGRWFCQSLNLVYVQSTLVTIWPVFAVAIGCMGGALAQKQPKRGPQFCPCGYDLTGNVSGICPECGYAVKKGKFS